MANHDKHLSSLLSKEQSNPTKAWVFPLKESFLIGSFYKLLYTIGLSIISKIWVPLY